MSVNHVGITVPDIAAGIDWYRDVFGFECIMGPHTLEPGPAGELPPGLDSRFGQARMAGLQTRNGVGIELFEFIDPVTDPRPDVPVEYTRRGTWHLCLTVPDVEKQTHAVAAAGGRVITPPRAVVAARPWTMSYLTDPWGTVIELMSHDYTEIFTNWPTEKGAHP
ncbi:VOC family protein [Mycobacteroides chelonae]|uniref:VOC family protein n=1 Tax=Mycobacteroides chelonae TaxID=1774 RepID=UPI000962BC75|nr:VOC family protein [Mycobacteroides chelonae]MEC4838864.1 VOC family protein [Mycobacteroides chelonae]MEC4845027.1 VOC family protein [Mycobacteroides chelonae]OLT84245.1 glyoxalase [Mycobacteroides chelonae]WED94256.1 VOC family protein [Mycobacteroides chelonae]WED97921.1 VOC family protein [Mycobacteroides chelonae]